MLPSLCTLTLIGLIVAGASHASPATLPFVTKLNPHGIPGIVERDRDRAQAVMQLEPLGRRMSIDATNTGFHLITEIGVGQPPTNYTVLVDTGSANTWVGAIKPYSNTSTSQDTGHPFNFTYGTGGASGEEWTDSVTLSSDLVVRKQSIGVVNHTTAVFPEEGLDGIFGLGPVELTRGRVQGVDTVPTVMDNLYSEGSIPQEIFGIKLVPYCKHNSSGEITFGGYDKSAMTSTVVYAPLTTTPDASHFWGLNLSMSYGAQTIMPSTAGIVDTGSTLIYLPDDAFKVYKNMTGATFDNSTGFYKLTPDQYKKLKPLTVHVEGHPLELTPNAQIMPRSLMDGDIYLAVHEFGAFASPTRLFNLVLGFSFLERYYSIYDAAEKRVGFAATSYTHSECN